MNDRLARARAIFEVALSRRSLQLPADDCLVESLARLAAFTANVSSRLVARPRPERVPYTTAAATELAATVRKQLLIDDINPLFDLTTLLSTRLGILVFPIRHSVVGSASAQFDQQPQIFISRELGIDQLFGCARELAHLLTLFSRIADDNFAHISPIADGPRRGAREYFATNFAIELLVPTRGFAVALRKVRDLLKVKNSAIGDIELLYLARIFGVNFSTVARKCERLQLLPSGGAIMLEKFISEQFGSAEQRAVELGLPDRPVIHVPLVSPTLLLAIDQRIRLGGLSHAQAAEALGTSESKLLLALARSDGTLESFWQ